MKIRHTAVIFQGKICFNMQVKTTRTRNGIVSTVSIRTSQGKTIRLGNGDVYLYGVLKTWKEGT